MKHFMMAGLLVGLCAMTGYTAETASASYDATVAARYVDLDTRGNRGNVQEYDGKLYYVGHGDVHVGNQGTYGLFDISLKDIGSTEEMGALNVDYGSLKMSAKWENMHHRMNYNRGLGMMVNGGWTPNSSWNTYRVPSNMDILFRRTETEFNIAAFNPENSAQWISAQYWSADKKGQKYIYIPTNIVGLANIDNTKQDITLGVGTSLGEKSAMSLALIRNEFEDNAAAVDKTTPVNTPLPTYSQQTMTGAQFKWRYDVSKNMAMTAAFTGRQRENLFNQYKMNAVVGAFNAAYDVSNKLGLTARLYARGVQIDENNGWRSIVATGNIKTGDATGFGNELDKTTIRGQFAANYQPVEKLSLKADYTVELNHRRDAPAEVFTGDAHFADGVFIPANGQANIVANEDVKHIVTLGATAELPFGIEAEAGYRKLQANRPAFISMPMKQDTVNAMLTVPLPGRVDFMVMGDYSKESNNSNMSNYHQSRNSYRTGLDWAATNKTSLGVDGSYETIRYNTEGYFAMYDIVTGAITCINLPHEGGMRNTQKNTTLGAHTQVKLPKGLVVFGNGSYTWSVVHTPVHFGPDVLPFVAGKTPIGTSVGDVTPSDVRIARGTLTLEYTPEKYQNLTARASYTINDWVDKMDSTASGRASVAQLGASMKF